jgi:cytochrome c1
MQNWMLSVNTVNAWLNDPTNTTNLDVAIIYAEDEPIQLATMMKTPQLSTEGMDSAQILAGNFPSIVANLKLAQSGGMTADQSTTAINFNRCCTVLPAIGSLWTAANKATAGTSTAQPSLANQCASVSCVTGTSAS